MDLNLFIIYFLTFAVVFILHKLSQKNAKTFPSPWGLPLLGHVPFILGRDPAKWFLKWKQECGSVYELNLAGKRVIVLNDRKSITECFSKQEFAGRDTSLKIFQWWAKRSGGGIFVGKVTHAEELRSFFLKSFREHGIQKNKMGMHFQDEIDMFVKTWHSMHGVPFELSGAFGHLVLNCVWRVLGSKRYEPEDTKVVLGYFAKVTELASLRSKLSAVIPQVLNPFTTAVEEKVKAFDDVTKIQIAALEERKKTWTPGTGTDIVDKFLDKVDETTDPGSIFHKSHNSIASATRDVFLGAIETTSTTLEWFIRHGIRNPKVIEKLQTEIDSVIGRSRQPSLEDRVNMPYTEACVLEVLRTPTLVPLGVPHNAIENTTFRGVPIRSGTLILSNLYALHHDPAIWDSPQEFQPERFLAPDGTLRKDLRNNILPFGVGRRSCIGLSFVEDELFLIISNLYQQFEIQTDANSIPMDTVFGLSIRPAYNFKISVQPRSIPAA